VSRAPSAPLLFQALGDPGRLPRLSVAEWDRLLREARRANALARIDALVADRGPGDRIPERARQALEGARLVADQQHRLVRWEVARIRRALDGLDVRLVLLKGAAYVHAGLPPARGRMFNDVDVMVPEDRLPQVEARLRAAGWTTLTLDPYDDRYYRAWSHELPPMHHPARGIVVDLHHNILPPVGRVNADARPLLEAAAAIAPGLAVLAPADMVLHTAVHLFQSGELHSAVRDLTDLDALLRHFGRDPGFPDAVVARGRALGLGRPLYYSLRLARRLLGTHLPAGIEERAGAPSAPVRAVMDGLVARALVPRLHGETPRGAGLSRWLLYTRYHWQRMPAWMLARHLMHKAMPRPRPVK
jgi:hypothetical protein